MTNTKTKAKAALHAPAEITTHEVKLFELCDSIALAATRRIPDMLHTLELMASALVDKNPSFAQDVIHAQGFYGQLSFAVGSRGDTAETEANRLEKLIK